MNGNTSDPPANPRHVLAIRLSALGDVVHTLPALDAAQQMWPDAEFDWVSETMGATLLEGHPGLSRVLRFPRKEWSRQARRPSQWRRVLREWRDFRRQLRERQYDAILDFQGNMRSAWVCMHTRSKSRFTHHADEVKDAAWLYRMGRPQKPSGRTHRVLKNLHLVESLGWSGAPPPGRLPSYEDEMALLRSLPEFPTEAWQDGPPILFHPFVSAAGRFKEWPAQYYSELGQAITRTGRSCVVSWAPSDREIAEAIVRDAGAGTFLAPPTAGVRQAAALIALCGTLVSGDTGVAHIAAALGVPVVALFGPKDPTYYAPWNRDPCNRDPGSRDSLNRDPGQRTHRTVRTSVPCSPCTLRRCSHAICMQAIHPREVLSAVEATFPAAPSR